MWALYKRLDDRSESVAFTGPPCGSVRVGVRSAGTDSPCCDVARANEPTCRACDADRDHVGWSRRHPLCLAHVFPDRGADGDVGGNRSR